MLAQASERVEQHVQHALDVAEDEADTIAALIGQRWLDPEDQENVSTYFLAALEARPSLSYLSFGMPSGKYYHAFRDRDGGLSVLLLTPEEDGSRRLFEFNVLPDDGARQVVRGFHDPSARHLTTGPITARRALWAKRFGRSPMSSSDPESRWTCRGSAAPCR